MTEPTAAAIEAERLIQIVCRSGFCPNQISDGPIYGHVDCDYPNCRDSACDFWQKADATREAFTVSLGEGAERARREEQAIRALTPSNQEDTALLNTGARPILFVDGSFESHSGLTLPFKIDCDALSDDGLATLAAETARIVSKFQSVYGIPRGGLRFATALDRYATGSTLDPTLIVDDVLSTGASMEQTRSALGPNTIGVVIFARAEWPDWITPLFVTGAAAKSTIERARREGWEAGREECAKWHDDLMYRAGAGENDRLAQFHCDSANYIRALTSPSQEDTDD